MIPTEIYELARALYESDARGRSFEQLFDNNGEKPWVERAYKVAEILTKNQVRLML